MSPNPSLAMFTKDTVGHKWLIIYESGDFNLRASWFYMVCPISKNASLCRGAICALGQGHFTTFGSKPKMSFDTIFAVSLALSKDQNTDGFPKAYTI